MESTQYLSDGSARIIELLRTRFGDFFKIYYDGQVNTEDIPESMLPCIMVSEGSGRIEADATGTDLIEETINIAVIARKKDDIGASNESIKLSEYKMRKLVKGQDPTTGQYYDQSIMGVLRTHISMNNGEGDILGSVVIDTTIETDFDTVRRDVDNYLQVGYITMTVQRLAAVPSRF